MSRIRSVLPHSPYRRRKGRDDKSSYNSKAKVYTSSLKQSGTVSSR
jgi:hypothetical protein